MLRVTIELVPRGVESRKQTLAVGEIINDATGAPTVGNYEVRLYDAAGRRWRHGVFQGFPRRRLLAWDLLYRRLRQFVGSRNEKPLTFSPKTVSNVRRRRS